MINLVEEKFRKYQETNKPEEKPGDAYTMLEIVDKLGISIELVDSFVEELFREGAIETVTYIKEVTKDNKIIKETVLRAK